MHGGSTYTIALPISAPFWPSTVSGRPRDSPAAVVAATIAAVAAASRREEGRKPGTGSSSGYTPDRCLGRTKDEAL